MSALGHKRTFAPQTVMSAIPLKVDICSAPARVRFVPIADIGPTLFDHLVGAGKEWRWHCEAKRPSGLEVDDHFVLRRLLIGQIAGFFATKNTVDVGRAATEDVDTIRTVVDQATDFHAQPLRID